MGLRGAIYAKEIQGQLFTRPVKGKVPFGAKFLQPFVPLYIGDNSFVYRLNMYQTITIGQYGPASSMCKDGNSNIYTTGSNMINKFPPDLSVRLYQRSGFSSIGNDSFFDTYGNLWRACGATANQLNSHDPQNGNLIHSYSVGFALQAACLHPDGDIICVGTRTNNVTLVRVDPVNGNILHTYDHGATLNGVAVDPDGNYYISGVAAGGNRVRKFNSSNTLLWSRPLAATVRRIRYFNDGTLGCTAQNSSNLPNFHLLDVDGNILWSYVHPGAYLYDTAKDAQGRVYVVGGLTTQNINENFLIFSGEGELLYFSQKLTVAIRSIILA